MQGMISIRDVVHTMLKEHRWGPLFSLVSTSMKGGEGCTLRAVAAAARPVAAAADASGLGQARERQGPAGVQPQRAHHKRAGWCSAAWSACFLGVRAPPGPSPAPTSAEASAGETATYNCLHTVS